MAILSSSLCEKELSERLGLLPLTTIVFQSLHKHTSAYTYTYNKNVFNTYGDL